MRGKTFLAMLCVLTCAITLRGQVGGDSQTWPVALKQQKVSSVTLRPLEVDGPNRPQVTAEPNQIIEIVRHSLAVDENGDIYLAFSLQTFPLSPASREVLGLVKYDQTGRLITAFPIPDFLFVSRSELVNLRSIALFQDKVYVSAYWQNLSVNRKTILIYTKAGSYEQSIEIPGRFTARQVVVAPSGDLFVLGIGARQPESISQYEYVGTDMIIKLSPSGQVLTSFSPYPVDPHQAENLRWGPQFLLLDDAGRLIHVLRDATMRVFDLDGRLLKTMSPILPGGDHIYSVVRRDGRFVFSTRIQGGGGYQTVVSADGEVVSWTEITGEPLIKVQGGDGYYYAISPFPRRSPSDLPALQISKMRLDLSP